MPRILARSRALTLWHRPKHAGLFYIGRRRVEPGEPVVILVGGAALEQRIANQPLAARGVVDVGQHHRGNLYACGPHDADVLVAPEGAGEIAIALVAHGAEAD